MNTTMSPGIKTVTGIVVMIVLAAGIALASRASAPDRESFESGGTEQGLSALEDAERSYGLAEIASHGTAESCWSAIGDSVYDLTAWIADHPGGAEAVLGLCGRDGTAAFQGQHEGQPNPENRLSTFRIGAFQR